MRFGREAIAVALLGACIGCARDRAAVPALEHATDASAIATSDAASAEPLVSAGVWADAIRVEKWDEAWRGIEALAATDKRKPEVRYARARVAMARGDAKSAIESLAALEGELPLLADDVRKWRAEAQLASGAYEDAADYYSARGTAAGMVKAATAYERAGQLAKARVAADHVLSADHRARAQEAEARALRLRLSPADAAEADDARWLAVKAPDLAASKDALALLTKLSAKLTSDEWLARADALTDAGQTDEALHAIERVESAPGRKVPRLEWLRAKGDTLYRARSRYLEAARVLVECATLGGDHAAEDAFRAARALARADHDEEAMRALRRIVHAYPKSTWAEQSSFLMGRLELLHGKWKEAAVALDAYAREFPNGAEKREAARDRALAHLLANDHAASRKLFEELAEDEPDALASARARTMAALAAMRDGDRTHAIARWTDVARSKPLSWPALVARARLAEVGAPLPPPIDPGDPGTADPPLAITLPPPVDVLHRIGLDGDAEIALRDRETVITAAAPSRAVEALCAAYGMLGRAKRRYQVAQQIPAALLASAPTPKTRWSWECAFPRPYEDDVDAREKADALPEGLVYAVMRQESGFDPDVVSPARAVGLLQLMPETANAVAPTIGLSLDDAHLTSPPFNVALGARYLHDLSDRFHGTLPLAVAAYNGGPDSVTRWLQRPRGLDLDVFVERIPFAETRAYVARVMGNFARYGYLRRGDAGVPTVDLHPRSL